MTDATTTPAAPYGKFVGTVVGGAVSVLVIYALNRFMPPPALPDYVCGAIQTLITAAVTYFFPHTLTTGN